MKKHPGGLILTTDLLEFYQILIIFGSSDPSFTWDVPSFDIFEGSRCLEKVFDSTKCTTDPKHFISRISAEVNEKLDVLAFLLYFDGFIVHVTPLWYFLLLDLVLKFIFLVSL